MTNDPARSRREVTLEEVSITYARRNFSRLIDEVVRTGQSVIVTRYGTPLVMIVALQPELSRGNEPSRPEWFSLSAVSRVDPERCLPIDRRRAS
ncbi:type II toxin-antitoxin system prevent-host-death family antitoxin [Agromyces sp. CFH 90414]|uniref:Antitoxin n=1 Tax=Agromyces agglutinans TaxID=2662258 RepID=A0A6I2FDT7_9MICO|nr:type II toxin-antitoxin system prevent-host-death family antitoxin [Agromyces agglutinans]